MVVLEGEIDRQIIRATVEHLELLVEREPPTGLLAWRPRLLVVRRDLVVAAVFTVGT
jgi:hypothetical protein